MEHLGTFILTHWHLWLALLVILLLIYLNETLDQKKRIYEISPQNAVKKINHDSATLFDLRSRDEFQQGHIVDSVHTTDASFEQKKMEKYKTKPIILICSKGLQSRQTTAKLRTLGFTEVYMLSGGIEAWKKADLPLIKK